ncbi:UmuC protein [Streptomyces sp. NBRC 110611]|uniref:hypothetical protein n=1 Tax=Streptomyces sp. NBRC 110611 TaxID=1621259 RepID=UPI0008303E6D|nr:hypothetical protein [Streptomyces sp. NBRC 110611]GAU68831.1 UmuC protein [Streptomyces sp. NBRC 110611]
MTGIARTVLETLLRWLFPARGGHRAAGAGVLSATAWREEGPPRRRLVYVQRVPTGLLLSRGEDSRLVRPYVAAMDVMNAMDAMDVWQSPADQDARRRELEERVRRLNGWSSGGGGRR